MNPSQISNLKKVVRVVFAIASSTLVASPITARSEVKRIIPNNLETDDTQNTENENTYPSAQITDTYLFHGWEVFQELRSVDQEAKEEGYPVPSQDAKQTAVSLLGHILEFAGAVTVYPTPDGEIAIDAYSKRGSVVVLCEPSGNVFCMSNVDGVQKSNRFSPADTILYGGLLEESLLALYA